MIGDETKFSAGRENMRPMVRSLPWDGWRSFPHGSTIRKAVKEPKADRVSDVEAHEKDSPLTESGLLGPVRLRFREDRANPAVNSARFRAPSD
jgi:hypothetical protein